MDVECHPLPIRIEPFSDEGGVGLLLRVAQANGMRLSQLLGLAGVNRLSQLNTASLRVLSFVTHVPLAWLLDRVPHGAGGAEASATRYMSQTWVARWTLRGPWPQVCPLCLHEAAYARMEWDLTALGACPRHGAWLTNRCTHCGKALNWGRPSVLVCDCGRYLSQRQTSAPAASDVVDWCRAFAKGVGADPAGHWAALGLPNWMDGLSACGLIEMLLVFGLRERAHQVVSTHGVQARSEAAQVTSLMVRGLDRARRVDPNHRESIRKCAGLIHDAGLTRLMNRGSCEADRSAAYQLLAWLNDKPRSGLQATGRRPQGQMGLFEMPTS